MIVVDASAAIAGLLNDGPARRRLAAEQLTPDRLATLQQRADDVARAEAEALEAAQKVRDETPQQSPIEIPSK